MFDITVLQQKPVELKEPTKRYFFTNELIAAYMAQEFGVQICSYTPVLDEPEESPWLKMYLDLTYPIEGTFIVDSGDSYKVEKYYVHPDSYKLLEPVQGDLLMSIDKEHLDLITCGVFCADWEYPGYEESFKPYQYYFINIGDASQIIDIDNFNEDGSPDLSAWQTIRRDNKLFHYPESEPND